ncbi:MAG: RsmD family RNA methyltransferase [Fuerstiella sp.]
MSLRIISGDYSGRKLMTPAGETTRPYTERVRQKVFDRLGDEIEGSRVADIFSGVGTMGLEGLSRGASSCVFFEADPDVHEALSKNVEKIAGDHTTLCWKTNVHRTSFVPSGVDDAVPYDLVFFDPPYVQCDLLEPKKALGKGLTRLARDRATAPEAKVILRTPDRVWFSGVPGWRIDDIWHISTMRLWILKKTDSKPTESPRMSFEKSGRQFEAAMQKDEDQVTTDES